MIRRGVRRRVVPEVDRKGAREFYKDLFNEDRERLFFVRRCNESE